MTDAESKTTTFQDADGEAPHARCAEAVGLSECPHCHEPKPPHRVCTNCGYYRGRQARAVDERVSTCVSYLRAMIRIAVDAMGGDDAPAPRRRRGAGGGSALRPRRRCSSAALAALEPELERHPDVDRNASESWMRDDVVEMDESPAAALRRKPRASIKVAAEAVARGDAAALFSAGHTGATVMAAHAAFGMLPGVDRPALAATIPTERSRRFCSTSAPASSAGRSTCCSLR